MLFIKVCELFAVGKLHAKDMGISLLSLVFLLFFALYIAAAFPNVRSPSGAVPLASSRSIP